MTADLDDLAQRLGAALQRELITASAPDISDLKRTSSGLSRENWTFLAHWDDATGSHQQAMILRRDPRASLLQTDRRHEFKVLRALEASNVPAPPVRLVDVDGAVLGAPALIMDLLDGDCDWFVLNGSRPLATRVRLAKDFMALLVTIQGVDCHALGLVESETGPFGARVELAYWEAELRRVQLEPLPEMELALSWLDETAPAMREPVLVHGDYKPGNALLVDDRLNAMLDWETAHLGDPLEDLGWMTNPVRAREQQITGHWEREQMVAAFSRLSGREVDDATLRWWNVFANFKLAAILLSGVQGFVSGELDRIYHAPSYLYQNMFDMMGD